MRELCYDCLRPKASCYCRYISPVDCGIKFVFLMHPKEAKHQRTGTGRLAHLCLPQSEILMGIDFSDDSRLRALLADSSYQPLLLYPGQDAWTAESPALRERLSGDKSGARRTPLVIVIDSTWFCSKKMLRQSQCLHGLPRLSFSGSYRSIFTFKTEPAEHCVSTIESCYYTIREFQDAGLCSSDVDPGPLMTVFKKMIQFQLMKENERITLGLPSVHEKDWKYTKLKEVPAFD